MASSIHIRLDDETKKALRQHYVDTGTPMSKIASTAIRQYLFRKRPASLAQMAAKGKK